jgi:hypothetical protein
MIIEDLEAVIDLPEGLEFSNILSGDAFNPLLALFTSIF